MFKSPGEVYSKNPTDDDFMFKVLNNYTRFVSLYNTERSKKSQTTSFTLSRPPQLEIDSIKNSMKGSRKLSV